MDRKNGQFKNSKQIEFIYLNKCYKKNNPGKKNLNKV